MPNITDQEFDNLFREAANRINPRPERGDWEDMSRRLDGVAGEGRGRTISLYTIALLLCIHSILPLRTEQGSTVKIEHPEVTAISPPPVHSVDPEVPDPSATLSDKKHRTTKHRSSDAVERQAMVPDTGDQRQTGNEQTNNDHSNTLKRSSVKQGMLAPDQLRVQKRNSEMQVIRRAGPSGTHGSVSTVISGSTSIQPLTVTAIEAPSFISMRSFLPTRWVDSLTEKPLLQADALVKSIAVVPVAPVVVNMRRTKGHALFMRAVLAPDFTAIDYGSPGKSGFNAGVMFDYALTSRFMLTAGAVWSRKLYNQANPEKSYGQGGSSWKVDRLYGDCRIVDIPVNVAYYFGGSRKTNWFVAAGVSSYIMLEEEYVFTVRRYNHDYEYIENYANGNSEWGSMLNVSVGMQHQIARRWFVQGEPFLKAPLKGVGEGKVNLVSTGVFFSVKYLLNP